MSKCANCDRDVYRYKVVRGNSICYHCYPNVVLHRLGYQYEGSAVPTQTDHCKNLGLPKPSAESQNWEFRQMERVDKAGGETRIRPNMQPVLRRLGDRNGVRRLRGL